jgi:hypothetical protein
MVVILMVLAGLAVYGGVASVVAVRTDGYGAVPTRRS